MGFNTYNNNQQKQPEYSLFSNYRMNNAESKIDATCISFKYWKSSLCIGIFPRKNTGNDEIAFDMDNGITIYLSHTKARILKNELINFLNDPVKYNGSGVPSGQAVITISNGNEYGKNTPVITIRKVDATGNVTASFAYEFKTNYYYSIHKYIGDNFDTDYESYNNIEIEQFITVLDEYIKASTNAIAFSVMDQRKYSLNRIEGKIDAMAEKLGVEIQRNNSYGNNKNYNTNSYFSSNKSETSYDNKSSDIYEDVSIDDLE